jgi:hypothetical protein
MLSQKPLATDYLQNKQDGMIRALVVSVTEKVLLKASGVD